MSPTVESLRDREKAHRVLFAVLVGLLAAFSVWCGVQLWRAHGLRQDLDRQLGWVDDVRRLRGELDRLPVAGDAGIGDLDLDVSRRLAQRQDDPGLQVALQNLVAALDRLRGVGGGGDPTPDAVWEATVEAANAVAQVEDRVQGQGAETYGRLRSLWTGLYLLIVASLLLAGSNLALLRLARRRRLRLEEVYVEALRQATQDPLTRVWNREAILNLLRRELVRAGRLGSPLGVILADVDGFGQVNVLLGEDQGDFVLEQLASRLGSFVRPYDTMGRFGGDSFLFVLPMCDGTATGNVAARLAEAINERDVEHALGRIRVTVSIAYVTVSEPEDADADLLIHRLQEQIAGLQAQGPGKVVKLQ